MAYHNPMFLPKDGKTFQNSNTAFHERAPRDEETEPEESPLQVMEAAKKRLDQERHSLKKRDELMLLAAHGDLERVRFILGGDRTPDVGMRDFSGYNLVAIAAEAGHAAVMAEVADAGASVDNVRRAASNISRGRRRRRDAAASVDAAKKTSGNRSTTAATRPCSSPRCTTTSPACTGSSCEARTWIVERGRTAGPPCTGRAGTATTASRACCSTAARRRPSRT